MPAPTFNLFARLAKYDEESGIFEAVAADESIDKAAERFHYESSKPHFAKWSQDISKATDGKSVGNVRSMHGKNAAGKLTDLVLDDASRAIKVRGQVVDPVDKAKMAAGVYTGVSIGGSYEKKWDDPDNVGVKWYTAIPAEISIVDNPCNGNAHFTMVKADGAHEVEFLSGDALKAAIETIEKSVSGAQGDATTPPVTAATASAPEIDPEKAAVNKIAEVLDAGTIKPTALLAWMEAEVVKAADAHRAERAAHLATEAAREDLTNGDVEKLAAEFLTAEEREAIEGDGAAKSLGLVVALRAKAEKVDAPVVIESVVEAPAPVVAPVFRKGLYDVSCLAEAVANLDMLCSNADWEAAYEGDASPVPTRLKAVRDELAMILVEMADEETRELTEADKAVAEGLLEKAGARHSKADLDRLQAIHDHSIGMGASCSSEKAARASLAKALGMAEAAESDVEKVVVELRRKATLWDNAPAAPKGSVRAVSKASDIDPNALDKDTDSTLARDNELKAAAEKAIAGDPAGLVKLMHQHGGRPGLPPPMTR